MDTDFEQYRIAFEEAKQSTEDFPEYWEARTLQELLGYPEWRSMEALIKKAMTNCKKTGQEVSDHFVVNSKMVQIGSGAKRKLKDYILSRYACYLIALNGNPRNKVVAYAKDYFAAETRKMEKLRARLKEHQADLERIDARKTLTQAEKQLSESIYSQGVTDGKAFGRIRSKGDKVLFGGNNTQEMKEKLEVPQSRPLADFLHTAVLGLKIFASGASAHNIKKKDLKNEQSMTSEHQINNKIARNAAISAGTAPENYPAQEDIKKVKKKAGFWSQLLGDGE